MTTTSIDVNKLPLLIILTGPTGIGKTNLSLRLAMALDTVIVSADSRQLYKGLKIGTAAPTNEQLDKVPHYMVGTHSLEHYYNAYEYEQDVLELLQNLFQKHNAVLLVGGSMMYIDAVCYGIDDLPTISSEVREQVMELYNTRGLEFLQDELLKLDPQFHGEIDLKNPKRVIHAIEVCYMTGKPYSSLRTRTVRQRPFRMLHIGLDMDRDELYGRINRRVDMMMSEGLEDEARMVYPMRHLNSLNTVGYKELFDYFDGNLTREEAVELIKRNSRRYAKRQLTWYRRDKNYNWFHPKDEQEIIKFVIESIGALGQN